MARSLLVFFCVFFSMVAHIHSSAIILEKRVREAGEIYFSNRIKGYEEARVVRAQQILLELVTAHPENAMLYSLIGRTYFLIASNSTSPIKRYKNLNNAITYWQKSYDLARDDTWIRYNCYKDISSLPHIIGYSDWKISDTAFLFSKTFGRTEYKTTHWLTWRWFHATLLPPEKYDPQEIPLLAKQMILYQIGLYYYRLKNYEIAKSFLFLTVRVNPSSNYASTARAFFRDYLWW